MLGHAEGPLIGKSVLDLMPETAQAALKRSLVRAAYFGERSQTDIALEDPQGGERWLEVLCRPLEAKPAPRVLFRRQGEAWKKVQAGDVLLIGKDITERKREAARLAQAKKAAEAQSEAKSLFLANMSHELRTPLNSILGFAQIIDGEHFGPVANRKYKEYAGLIEESGRYLLELINDILDLSKVEAGKYQVELSEVNLVHTLERTLRLMAPQYREKGVKLLVEIEPDLAPAWADQRCVRQILFNLLSNALKFTNPGGTVSVILSSVDGGLEIAVNDTGIGISREDLARLANPFEQAASALTSEARGTGLGLSLVRRFAELQHGTFEIDSELGRGTSVRTTLVKASGHDSLHAAA